MQCKFCDEPLERQDDYVVNGVGEIINKGAIYSCFSCGREWRWELGVPGLATLFDEEDFGPPEPAWTDES